MLENKYPTASKVEEIYQHLKLAKKGNWRYDDTTLQLVLDLGGDNVIKTKIPDRAIGSFLADSAEHVSWLLEAILTIDECAQRLMDTDEQKGKFIDIINDRLFPKPETQEESEPIAEIPGVEGSR